MKKLQKKQAGLRRRHTRVRGKISGTAARPRLCITRSNSNMYAQVIDDVAGKTICGVSTLGPEFKATEKSGATVDGAAALGLIIGKKAQENGVTEVVFDRGGNLYHGRIKAVADGAEPEVEDRHLELKNVATGDLALATDDEKKEAEDATKENEDLFNAMKEALGDKVEKVAVSARLTDAPACITTEGPLSLEMEKVLQKGPEGTPDGMPKSQRVLELNAKHPVFAKLVAAQKAGDADKIKQYSGLLYDQALLVEGILPEDPVAFAAAVCNLM